MWKLKWIINYLIIKELIVNNNTIYFIYYFIDLYSKIKIAII